MPPPFADINHPLMTVCDTWLRLIEEAKKVKEERFGCYAKEAMQFYDGAHDWMWKNEYATGAGGYLVKGGSDGLPTFRMTVNKVFEAVALFGPALYHQYPSLMVTPVQFPQVAPEVLGVDLNDPYMAHEFQQMMMMEEFTKAQKATCANLKQHYLNWLQVEQDKKTQARLAINEAIIKGMGLLQTEMHQPLGSNIRYPRSRYLSVDDVVLDPDADYWDDVQWAAIRCCHPVNLTEEDYGLRPGDLIGHYQSKASQATPKGRKESKNGKQNAGSYDLIEYWKVYSKNGFGHRLKSTNKRSHKSQIDFEQWGKFNYIVVAKNIPYPLNMPSWSLLEDPAAVFQRAQWPIPYWTDGGWSFSRLHFYEKPKAVWPISLIKPAIGELRFVNWCMSFLADKVANASTDYLFVAKAAAEDIRNQLLNQTGPYKLIELSEILGKSVSDLASWLQAPQFHEAIWKMVAEVMELIDKRTGLTELIYGLSGTQIRSAQEASIKEANVSIRPDEMASRTEDFLSDSARKEMEAICWLGERDDVAPVLGPMGADVFERLVFTQDFDSVVRDFSYRVEAGSARKPNKRERQRSLTELGQVILPTLQEYAVAGQVGPWNAYMRDVAKAMDLDAESYMLPEPEPQEGPSPEEQKAEMEIRMMEFELQMKTIQHQQDTMQKEETHEQDMAFEMEKFRLEQEIVKAKAELDAQVQKKKAAADAQIAKSKAKAAAKAKPKPAGAKK